MAGILIVEDDKAILESISTYLKSLGHKVETATDGLEGLKKFRERPFDVVISDIRLPSLNGLDLVKKIRKINEDTIIIIITAYASMESAIESLKVGASGYIRKPFLFEELQNTLNAALEKKYCIQNLTSTLEKLKKTNKKLLRYQKRLRSAQEKIIQTEKLSVLYKFASFIVHDLKNLVSTLSLAIYGLQIGTEKADFIKPHIDAIAANVEKMKELIAKFSNLPNDLEVKFKKCDIASLIREVIGKFKISHNIDIIENLNPLPLIDCDDSLQIVFYNLIKNSIKAMPFGGKLFISTSLTRTGKSVKIRITDTGHGIPENLFKNLFKPFQTTKKKGLGIGLYQCKEIIKKHKGKITLKSRLNQGTECLILLPVAQGK